jgi:hypothetical protein
VPALFSCAVAGSLGGMNQAASPLAALIVLIAATSASAQPTGLPTSDASGLGLSVHASSIGVGKSPFKAGNTKYNEVSSTEHALGVSQAIALGGESALELSLEYRRAALKFASGKDATLPLPKRLQSLGLGFIYNRTYSPSWSGTFGTSLVSAQSGSELFSSRGLGVDVFAAATYQSSPTLSFTGGVAYSSLARGTVQVFPVLGMNWTPSPEWTVAIGVPQTGVTYRFSDSFSLGLVAAGQGGAYHVETNPAPGGVGQPNLSRTTLDYFAVGAALKADWRASEGISLSASIGRIFIQEFEYASRGLKFKADDDSLYYQIGLHIAL